MTALPAAPILHSAPTVAATEQASGVEEAGVLVWARAQRSRRLCSCLAVWIAALLVIAPLARPSMPHAVASVAGASIDSLASRDESLETPAQPTSGVRPAQPSTLGVVARASLLEKTLGLAPVKYARLVQGADHDLLLASSGAGKPQGETRQILHRSSVGTARAPTGPPL